MALTQVSQAGAKDEAINEAKIQISNAGTNGQYLQKQSGNAGGLTWATVDLSTFTADVTFDNQSNAGRDIVWDESDDALEFADNTKAVFGSGNDLEIYHDGSNSYIKDAGTGSLAIASNELQILNAASNEDIAHFNENGGVELFYDNSKKFETTTSGATVTGELVTTGDIDPSADGGASLGSAAKSWYNIFVNNDIHLADNGQALFGDGNDLSIYHDGSDSYIKDSGTGHLKIDGSRVILRNVANDDPMVDCIGGGTVELYHNGAKKLETTSAGGTLTGTWTGAGKVLQVVTTVKQDAWSEDLSNASYSAVVSGLTVAITPASSSNKVLIMASVAVSQEHGDRVGVSITKGGSTFAASKGTGVSNRVGVGFTSGVSASTQAGSVPVMYLDSPSSTSELTYGIKIMQGSGGTSEVMVNQQATGDSDEANRFRYVSTITAMEIAG